MILASPPRRLLVLAATAFFIASVYLCITRLFAMSFSRESFQGNPNPPPPAGGTDTTTDSEHKGQGGHKEHIKVELNRADLPMTYGKYNRPAFDGLTLIGALPDEYVPTVENKRRLIVMGDIHGMDSEFDALLEKIPYDEKRDHIIAVGDMISKGPDSSRVVSRLMDLNASAVRGNHEDRVLLAHENLKSQFGVMADLETTHAEERRGELQDLVVARELTQDNLDWLASLPVILTIDPLLLYIVHAGLVPGVDIDQQDPWAVMNMRTLVYPREELRKKAGEEPRRRRRDETSSEIPGMDDTPALESFQEKVENEDDDTKDTKKEEDRSEDGDKEEAIDLDTSNIAFDRQIAVPNDGRKGEKWIDAWNSHQLRLPRRQRRTVIYGHDAKEGYKESKYTLGLDSACVKGDALSALVIEATEGGGFNHTTTQVRCKNKESEKST